jgi:PAS domain S-box-containing protein
MKGASKEDPRILNERLQQEIEERTRLQEALGESERRLQGLISSLSNLVFVLDAEARFVSSHPGASSPGLAALLKESTGKRHSEVMPPHVDRLFSQAFDRSKKGEVAEYECWLETGKETRWYHARLAPMFRNGEFEGVAAAVSDITERRHAAEGIHFMFEILETSPISVVATDSSGMICYVNPAAEELFGYAKEELLGKDPTILIADPNAQQIQAEILDSIENNRAWKGELLNRKRDGSLFYIESSVYQLFDVEGQAVAAIGFQQDISNRKRVEEELRESGRLYRLLAENVTDVIWITDMNLKPTYVSPSITRLTGYSVEEAMNRSMEEALTPASLEFAAKTFAEELAIEAKSREHAFKSRTAELEYRRKDGSTVWVEAEMTFLRDADGELIGLLGVTRDISRRKRAEESLRQAGDDLESQVEQRTRELSEANSQLEREIKERNRVEEALRHSQEELKAIFDDARDGIAVLNTQGRVVKVNRRILDIGGYSEQEIVGQRADSLGIVTDERVEELVSAFRRLMEGEDVHPFEVDLTTKSGRRIDVEVHWSGLTIGGQVVGAVAIIRNITDRKLAEEALRESEQKYSTLVEKATDGVFVLQDDECRFANRAFTEIAGYSEEEILRMPFLEISDPTSRRHVARRYRSRKSGEQVPPVYEANIRRKDGSTREVEVSTAPIQYRGRAADMGIVRDITERRRAERGLQSAYQQEIRLRRGLEDEIKRRGEFLRTLVHELKTPLTAILASSSALVASLPQGISLDFARAIERGAFRLDHRINELTDLAKGEIGILRLNRRQVDPLKLLREVAEDMASLASSKRQSLVLDLPRQIRPVRADEDRLRQVVVNLLGNAFKFTPEKGKITLGAMEKDATLVVYVCDTGPGISQEQQERLFDAYRRTGAGASPMGLGIGLALSKMLVELHGGQIWVESEERGGSTFSFSVPLQGGE